jgi:hypothetical protein
LALTPCLTNAVKRPDNLAFSEKNFCSHDGRGKILKVMKAQANEIILRTPGTNRVKNDYTVY